MSSSAFALLYQFFQRIYSLGDSVAIIKWDDFGLYVSLNDFLLAFAILSIVLSALVNFAKVHGDATVNMAGSSVRSASSRLNNRVNRWSKNFLSSMFD